MVKLGDLVTPIDNMVTVRSVRSPTFGSRGDERFWKRGDPALVIELAEPILEKACILLQGKKWWISSKRIEVISEAG